MCGPFLGASIVHWERTSEHSSDNSEETSSVDLSSLEFEEATPEGEVTELETDGSSCDAGESTSDSGPNTSPAEPDEPPSELSSDSVRTSRAEPSGDASYDAADSAESPATDTPGEENNSSEKRLTSSDEREFREEEVAGKLDGADADVPDPENLVGATLDDRHHVEECIGEGDMGVVYRAHMPVMVPGTLTNH